MNELRNEEEFLLPWKEIRMSDIRLRMATVQDAKEINQIYEKYILETPITFEYDPVPLDEFEERIRGILDKLPYLVCEIDGKIVGYAYVAPFKTRAAFGWDVEITVYLDENYHRRKIGKALYEALFAITKQLGYVNVYALITSANEVSVRMHESMGFEQVGFYPETGFKLGKWWGMYVLNKQIGDRTKKPYPVRRIQELDIVEIQRILEEKQTIIL